MLFIQNYAERLKSLELASTHVCTDHWSHLLLIYFTVIQNTACHLRELYKIDWCCKNLHTWGKVTGNADQSGTVGDGIFIFWNAQYPYSEKFRQMLLPSPAQGLRFMKISCASFSFLFIFLCTPLMLTWNWHQFEFCIYAGFGSEVHLLNSSASSFSMANTWWWGWVAAGTPLRTTSCTTTPSRCTSSDAQPAATAPGTTLTGTLWSSPSTNHREHHRQCWAVSWGNELPHFLGWVVIVTARTSDGICTLYALTAAACMFIAVRIQVLLK